VIEHPKSSPEPASAKEPIVFVIDDDASMRRKTSRCRPTPNPGWFRKGRSGNPGGRPTASRPTRTSAFDVVVEKMLTVTHQGATREITMEEALQQRTYRDAVAGKRMAQREVLNGS
jgi:Family of unknown function (DUF5681)